MKQESLFELIGQIDEKYIEEAGRENMKQKKSTKTTIIKWVGLVAAAAAISVALPNVNGDIAKAMENIPVLGKYFEIVTFRDYEYKDEHNQAEVSIPKIEVEESAVQQEKDTAESINKSVEEYAQGFIEQFEANLASQEEGYQGLDISYDVITDTQKWLTIKVTALEVQASGYEQAKFYNVDKTTGKEVALADLFAEGSDYVGIISENILAQMKEQMAEDEEKSYFFEGNGRDMTGMEEFNFKQIKEDQNFYKNEKGELVIAFDEYEVAPGYMGAVEFIIPSECLESILK